MRDTLGISLKNLKWIRTRNNWIFATLMVLSLIVTFNVFWLLRQPGLTLVGDASCGIIDHTHDDSCITKECICNLSEEAHVHDDSCYAVELIEEREETHLVCSETEEPHIHAESCFDIISSTTTERIVICGIQDETHPHDESCYQSIVTNSWEETVLICQLASDPHLHTENCFTSEIIDAHEEKVLCCALQEGTHIHDDACYELNITCQLKEHIHSIDCYSDETANLETLSDWQEMFASYPYTGNLREDLVGIAKTQVGYSESTLNFEVDSDGIRHGYTRYGAWYGTPYSDWSAMFVSFCLNYAGADAEQAPGNIGANSMAQQWEKLGKYKTANEYIPLSGDLVFFTDNTVGIVSEINNATFYAICGDVDGTVCSELFSLQDARIAGWGITETEESSTETEEEIKDPTLEGKPSSPAGFGSIDLLDISNGPAMFIFAAQSIATEEAQMPMLRQAYSLRALPTATQIAPYLEAYGGHYFFTLYDHNNVELPKDGDNYTAYANTGYKLSISFNSPNGFPPGNYEYQVPYGLKVDGGEGEFILEDGTNVGSWTVSDDGLISIYFNEHMTSRSEIVISSTLGIHFPMQEEPLDFDGKITVTIEQPPEEIQATKINKWGMQGNANDKDGKTDPDRLYWTVHIIGNENSKIPGNTITDKVLSGDYLGDHSYTQSNMDAGIAIGVSQPNPNGGDPIWHSWIVYPGDPNLTWTENGWSYTLPETINSWTGEVTLGNEGWEYFFNYSSTPERAGLVGALGYMNQATVDNQYAEGWAEFNHGEAQGNIVKDGSFVTDAGGGAFHWEFQVNIPGRQQGQKADYYWHIMDNMDVRDSNGSNAGYITNDANLATVTVNYHGKLINVPRIQDATENDLFAWNCAWSADHADGVFYGREIEFLSRCNCTAESCPFNYEYCKGYWYYGDDGAPYLATDFCQCWTETQDLTFTFTYKTQDLSMLENYGGLGNSLRNEVILYKKNVVPNEDPRTVLISDSQVAVPIPGLFDKTLTHDFDGQIAHYKITVNEAKLVLTNGTPLKIHDVMTDSLAFISGSLVITSEDANGNITTLRQGADYTVTYDGTGNIHDDYGENAHVLDITILHPQPVTYILDYDTTLIFGTNATEAVKYKNSAKISLWGEELTADTVEKVYANLNISAKSYKVDMYKTSAMTGDPLPGATFGLFNEQGGLISAEVTDDNGYLHFQTNVVKGIILREHELYYLQELEAPMGYQLDNTKHWFCFCNETTDTCAKCNELIAGKDKAFRIPFETVGIVEAANEIIRYDLPATGGPGVYPFVMLGMMFIVSPFAYGFILRRKQERRGDG